MGSDWPKLRLDEVTDLIVDCSHSTPKWTESGVIVLRSQYIKNGRLSLSNPSFTTEDGYLDRIKRAVPSAGDIVLTREAPMGEVCIVPKNLKCCLGQRMVLLRANEDMLDSEYLLYVLQSPFLQHQISWNEGTGTTVSNIRIPSIKAFQIPIPEISLQKRIANILSTIDNKIELNRQTNETLEKMAQALFKSWFVDFDPVIDNALAAGNTIPDELQDRAERRQQQLAKPDHQPLPDDIRQLFPSEFELTEDVGWVPMGWGVSSIGNVIENVGGGTPKTKEDAYWVDGMHAFCTPKDMSNMTSKILLNTERYLTKAGVLKVSSRILPVGTVLMSSRAPIGYLAITDIPVSINQGIIALKQNEKYSSEYLLCWAESNLEEVVSRANGSTFLEISKKNFRDIPFLEPEGNVLPAFANLAHSYFERIASLQRQVDQLTKLRDTLLPKLISGELRLPPDASADAEQQ